MLTSEVGELSCLDAADFNNDGDISRSDLVLLLDYLFAGGEPPELPFPDCGPDTGADSLDCESFPPCEPPGSSFGDPSAEMPIDGAVDLGWRLGQDQTLILPIKLVSSTDLAGFEFAVTFDPGAFAFVELERHASSEQDLAYFAAHQQGSSGRVRVGGIANFGLEQCLPAGTHDLGRLILRQLDPNALQGRSLEVVDCIYLRRDGEAVGASGERITVSTPDVEQVGIPNRLRLSLPNPLRVGSVMTLDLPRAGEAVASIYNVRGQKIRTLMEGQFSPGRHEIVWNGKSDAGQDAAPGIYYLRVHAIQEEITRKIAFVK
jgi:hypothetical protein